MSEDNKYLHLITAILGFICLLWIIYDIFSIYTNLKSVIFLGTAGLYMALGYLFILVFHFLVLIVYFIHLRKSLNFQAKVVIPAFLFISFLFLVIQKVMFDEVAREYYIEYPMPGETHFIVVGLLINGIFIFYSMFIIYTYVGVKHSSQ